MNFLPLCKAIIQHQRMSKGGYGFGAKNNRKADDMCYRKKFPFSFGKCLGVQLDVCGMFKNGDDCYTGTYTADDTVINAWEKNTVKYI